MYYCLLNLSFKLLTSYAKKCDLTLFILFLLFLIFYLCARSARGLDVLLGHEILKKGAIFRQEIKKEIIFGKAEKVSTFAVPPETDGAMTQKIMLPTAAWI